MKTILAALILLTLIEISCKKNPIPANHVIPPIDTSDTVRILGKWSIVTDSMFIYYQLSPAHDTIEVYTGVPADYYNFKANDSLYIMEGNVLEALQYGFNSGEPYQPIYTTVSSGNILLLTDSSMKLSLTHLGSSPEWSYADIIILKK
jgi:hypothetical protein